MTAHSSFEQRVRALLKNQELKLILDSPNGAYRFEYYTTTSNDIKAGEPRYRRTYRLLDLLRGGVTVEPWDTYDLDKQTTLVTGLLQFSHYKLTRVVTGWTIKCPSCGHVTEGKHWESVPKTCAASSFSKCPQRFDNADLVKEIVVDHAIEPHD